MRTVLPLQTFIPVRRGLLLSGCVVLLMVGLQTSAIADPPIFRPSVVIQNEAEELPGDETGCTAPCLGDWDGDGDMDLMIGTFVDAPVYLFRNISEGRTPIFELVGAMEADGEVIDGPFG